MNTKIKLNEYIETVPNFPIEGIKFKDISPLLENPVAFRECIDQMSEMYENENIDKIASFGARGYIFASVLAYKLNLPHVLIRKKGKLPKKTVGVTYSGEYADASIEMHVDSINSEDRVLLVDDVIAVGECMRAGCQLVEKLEGVVVGCFSVIEFTDLGSQLKLAKYDVKSLIKCEK
jgi:adenine phosphoribosyltransferase